LIKKGVRDRVNELADCEGTHPEHRPPYLHLIPLAEVIGLALRKSPSSKTVQQIWESLLAKFGSEVTVLIDAPPGSIKGAQFELNSVVDLERVVGAITAFRTGMIRISPGGGGKYGVIQLAADSAMDTQKRGKEQQLMAEHESGKRSKKQLSLSDF
jgi:uncharacterized protein (TIGR00375 family)